MSIGDVWRDGNAGSGTGIIAKFNLAALLQQHGKIELDDFVERQG